MPVPGVAYTPRMPKPIVLLVALALVGAACGESAAETMTTTTSTTTSTTSTTTTTAPTTTTTTTTLPGLPENASPISGLEVSEPDLLDRRALVVKIDNHPNARPQIGLPQADGVIELPVEGITRLVALMHTNDVTQLGPVRSLRPTDYQLAGLLGAPLVVSGGQNWVIAANVNAGAEIIGEVGRPQTFRSSGRRPPHNLYVSTGPVRNLADQREYSDDPPQALWAFGPLASGAERAEQITLDFSSSLVAGWTWDGEQYLRTTNGAVHEWIDADGARSQVSAETLVVLFIETFLQSNPAGGPAQASISVGTGKAIVFADGRVVEGEWTRSASSDPFTLRTDDGEPLLVPPGFPWISLFPRDQEVTW